MDSSTASATGLRGAHSSQMVEVSVSSSSGSGSSNGHYLHEITNLDNVYWLMPVGFLVGLTVVVIFERMQKGSKKSERKALFKSLTKRNEWKELDPNLAKKLEENVDSPGNIAHFWGGGALKGLSKERYVQVYEMLALVCALMLSICVSFYTSAAEMDHVYGVICCIANCALWMATLSSAFFVVAIGSCDNDRQVALLVEMYGTHLLRAPMILFVWGTSMLFLEFVFYFKIAVDPGFACSMCLTSEFSRRMPSLRDVFSVLTTSVSFDL